MVWYGILIWTLKSMLVQLLNGLCKEVPVPGLRHEFPLGTSLEDMLQEDHDDVLMIIIMSSTSSGNR